MAGSSPRSRRGFAVLSGTWVRVVGSIVLLALLLHQINTTELIGVLARIGPADVAVAWAFYLACQWLSAVRWRWLLLAQRISVSSWTLLQFYMVGMFMNNFLPGAVGGDVVKGYDLYRHIGRAEEATVSVFLERFTGLVGLGVTAVLASLVYHRYLHGPLVWFAVIGAAAILAVVSIALWHSATHAAFLAMFQRMLPRPFAERLARLSEAVSIYRKHGRILLAAIALSVVIQIAFAFYYSMIGNRLGIDIPARYFVLFLPMITLVSLLPVSVGGLGPREMTMAALFSSVGYRASDVVAISFAAFAINAVLSLWGAAVLLLRRRKVRATCST